MGTTRRADDGTARDADRRRSQLARAIARSSRSLAPLLVAYAVALAVGLASCRAPAADEPGAPRDGEVALAIDARGLPSIATSAPHDARARSASFADEDSPDARSDQREARPVFDAALLHAAGPLPPPGLSSAREAERQKERQAALDALRRHGDELGAGRLEQELAARLERPETELDWEAAALAAGGLRRLTLGREVARGLSHGGRRAATAARALHAMHGVWFESESAFEPFAGLVDAGQSEPHLRALGRQETASEQRFADLWRLDAKSIDASVSHASPAVRRRAAAALSNAVGASTATSEHAANVLLARAALEPDARALAGQLEALTAVLQGSAADSPLVARTRALLAELAAAAPPTLLHCIGRALAELPWHAAAEVAAPAPGLADAFAGLDALLERAVLEPRADPDVRVGLIEAARGLAQRANRRPGQLGDGGRAFVRRVLELAGRPDESPSVRRSAATSLADLAGREDVAALVELLRAADGDLPLRFALLGSLARVAQGLPEDDPRAPGLADLAVELQRDADADIRRRALALLAEPALERRLDAVQLDRLVDHFAQDPSSELASTLLGIVKRRGGRAHLSRLLALDAIETFAASTSARAAELTEAAARLASGDAELLFRAATRLVAAARRAAEAAGIAPPAELSVALESGRLARALELVARLDTAGARGLAPEQHARVVVWTHQLLASGASLEAIGAESEALAARELDVHLPEAAQYVASGTGVDGGPQLGLAEVERVWALVLGEDGTRAQVLGHLEAALAAAESEGQLALAFAIRRDRARFLAGRDEKIVPLADYVELVRAELAFRADPLGSARPPSLAPADLRTAATIAKEGVETMTLPAVRAAQAHAFARALVAHRAWPDEPALQRFQDVGLLAETAFSSGDPAAIARLAEDLADLPEAPETAASAAAPNGSPPAALRLWSGLTSSETWWTGLSEHAARARELVATAPPSRPAPPATPPAAPNARPEPSNGRSRLPGQQG